MASPSDLVPNKYEVVKLITGAEVCGMTRELKDGIEITLPMTCQLSPVNKLQTLATFIPYAPLSSDYQIFLPFDCIMHRSNMNEQFIDFYDEASAKWSVMVEEGNIPIINRANTRDLIKDTIDDIIRKSAESYEEHELEEWDDLDDEDKIIH